MKNKLLMMLLAAGSLMAAQTNDCSFGVASENTGNGGNISTGGNYEYSSATDFDVDFGTLFTARQVKFHAIKGAADVQYVKINFLKEVEGMPGASIKSFSQIVPTSQQFLSALDIEGMDQYLITVDLPTEVDLPKGKYFLEIQAASGDEYMVAWEIAGEDTKKLGRFDMGKFGDEPWSGGFSYYDQVFQISGSCAPTGQEPPAYGQPASQGNPSNGYETAFSLGGFNMADDFIVPENTTFYLNAFKMSSMQLGNMVNATVKIRKENNGVPGDVVYTAEKKGPKTENFYGYHPLDGYPLEVVAVDLDFEFDETIELQAGKYFLEIHANPVPYTDILTWEATTAPGIGGSLFWSTDDGETWTPQEGYNFVFDVYGFSKSTLGTADDSQQDEVVSYPNPVRDQLYIDSKTPVKNLSVYNAAGQLITKLKALNGKTDVSTLQPGVYFIKAELQNGTEKSFKIIKK